MVKNALLIQNENNEISSIREAKMFSFNHQYILQHRTSQPPGEKESYAMVKLTYPLQERRSYVN